MWAQAGGHCPGGSTWKGAAASNTLRHRGHKHKNMKSNYTHMLQPHLTCTAAASTRSRAGHCHAICTSRPIGTCSSCESPSRYCLTLRGGVSRRFRSEASMNRVCGLDRSRAAQSASSTLLSLHRHSQGQRYTRSVLEGRTEHGYRRAQLVAAAAFAAAAAAATSIHAQCHSAPRAPHALCCPITSLRLRPV
jgi:hypothetical protein